jgi:hypothetical protein
MIRREFFKNSLLAAAALPARGLLGAAAPAAQACEPAEFPKSPGLTRYVTEFIVNTKYEDIPANVIELGKKNAARRVRPGAGGIGFREWTHPPAIYRDPWTLSW